MENGPDKGFGYQYPDQGVYPPPQPAHGYPPQAYPPPFVAAYPRPQLSFQQQWPAMSQPEYNEPLYNAAYYQHPPPRSASFLRGLYFIVCLCCCCPVEDCCDCCYDCDRCGDRCCCGPAIFDN